MSRLLRFSFAISLPIAAVGIALARGQKDVPPADPPPPPSIVAEAPAAPPPALFSEALPLTLPGLPTGLSSLSAQGCNACHYAAHDSWNGSAHATAWKSPKFQAALKSAGGSTVCVQCHLPLSGQHDRLAAGYVDGDTSRPMMQANAAYDAGLQSEGVTCAACHVRGETVLGTHATTKAPHRVTVSNELQTPEMCATCHQLTWPGADRPFYDTYGEWKASRYAAAGVTCQMCHMAPESGPVLPGDNGTQPSHRFSADAARALSVLVKLPSSTVVRGQPVPIELTLQNTGSGHSFPTGNPFKSYKIEVLLVDSAGKEMGLASSLVLARTVDPKAPYPTTADNRLAAGAVMPFSTTLTPGVKNAAGRGTLFVRLVRDGQVTVLRNIPVEVQ